MRISGNVIPEHILRLMPKDERRRLGKAGLTMPEIEAKNARQCEKNIQAQIVQYLQLHDVPFFCQRMDRKTTGTVGWPDFSFVGNGGRACFLEVKVPGEKPTPEQSEILAALERAGAFVRLVHSLQEAIDAFREVGSSRMQVPGHEG